MAMMTSKYYVGAYYCMDCFGAHYAKAVDTWDAVEEFVWEYVQQGFCCKIFEHPTDKQWLVYAEDFNENTVGPQELIRDTKKDWRESLCTK